MPLLAVRHLEVVLGGDRAERQVRAVDGVSLEVDAGETVGIVGQSGSGKTMLALALLRLLRPRQGSVSGTVHFDNKPLLDLPERDLRDVRGRQIGMVFQEPMTSLNPVLTVGRQVTEVLERHLGQTPDAARRRAVDLLEQVGIPEPVRRMKEYPHQLSGGMRQRVMIAMAIACRPKLLIADEPTTALDVATQAQIIRLLGVLVAESGTALILITHNLGVVAGLCDSVHVMYEGQVVESAPFRTLVSGARHPYTVGLLNSVPRLEPQRRRSQPALAGRESPDTVGLLEVRDLRVHFPVREGRGVRRRIGAVHAVDGVDLELDRGTTLGLVGESGCGKTTLGRAVLRLVEPTEGTVRLDGIELGGLRQEELRRLRRRMQAVFQDPLSSLDPRQTTRSILAEPLRAHGARGPAVASRVQELLSLVGLPPDAARRYPYEFSSGQRQRIGVARALALNPDVVVMDEPVAALDVSTQAQIVDLLIELQARLGVAYLFISHDLAVVSHIADLVAVMYLGVIVEHAPSEELFTRPLHPYTLALLSAVPVPDPDAHEGGRRIVLGGEPPSSSDPPPGCRFHPRCPFRQPTRCHDEVPLLREVRPGHRVACHWAEELDVDRPDGTAVVTPPR